MAGLSGGWSQPAVAAATRQAAVAEIIGTMSDNFPGAKHVPTNRSWHHSTASGDNRYAARVRQVLTRLEALKSWSCSDMRVRASCLVMLPYREIANDLTALEFALLTCHFEGFAS